MGTMHDAAFDCHWSCCRREDHIDFISLEVDWAWMEGGDEGGGRTAFERGREQSELMFLTLFAVFFFCVWFLFSSYKEQKAW